MPRHLIGGFAILNMFMDFFALQTGLGTVWNELRTFLAGVRFARPSLIWLSLVPLLIAILTWLIYRKRKPVFSLLGRPGSIMGLLIGVRQKRFWSRFIAGLGWTSLVLGIAGPQWGQTESDAVAVGRDVILVIDLSRSMLAEDLTEGRRPRWKSATLAAMDFVAAAETRGGHRIGLVVFAAKAKLLVPLTTDYAHVRVILDTLDAGHPPDAIRGREEQIVSGTRIGAGLKLALEAHDPRFVDHLDVILLTDGDDPHTDKEWRQGISAARQLKVPVHVVGIGDPDSETPLFIRDRPIQGPDENGVVTQALSRLHEDVAKPIADETGGHYIPARREFPQLGDFFRNYIQPKPSRDVSDDTGTKLVDRSVWFYGASLLLLLFGWWREK